jgi:hypothetical protein
MTTKRSRRSLYSLTVSPVWWTPLRVRKVLYLGLALPACGIWIPLSLLGMALGIGIVGLLSLGSLLHCIVALPITSRIARRYHGTAISAGMLLMSSYIVLWIANERVTELRTVIWLPVSGMALVMVGAAVLLEMFNVPSQAPTARCSGFHE